MRGLTPVIILGAGRSGTNILRDCLTSLPGFGTWPCDEINYIWRHGNVRYSSDEFIPDMAKPKVQRYIRRQFAWVAGKYNVDWVVEKTCANSLRVEFVDQVLPDARYIFIYRDGLDTVGSAIKRWKAKMNISYLARKARFVPVLDLPYYGSRYLFNQLYKMTSKQKRLAFWGPKLDEMEKLLRDYLLEEVCALQWKRCVDRASQALDLLTKQRWYEVAYEDFVQNPQIELKRIINWLGYSVEEEIVDQAVKSVSNISVGKGRKELGKQSSDRILYLIKDTLQRYGYA